MKRLLVLAGPSAVGKGTMVAKLRQHRPDVWLSVSATTRQPRPGEVDGEHYFFVTRERFEQMIHNAELLEWATVHGKHYYGTPKSPVEAKLAQGQSVVLEIDLQGARQVKQTMPDALFVFVAPPSFESLAARLESRGTESEADRATRLETARRELDAAGEFDHVIVNDVLEQAVSELEALLA